MEINMEEVQKELEEFRKDTEWYQNHYEELLKQYPDHWVAIYDEKLVAASPDQDAMFAELKKKGVKATKAYLKYLSTTEEIWIFQAA